jgi:hypothetical protein
MPLNKLPTQNSKSQENHKNKFPNLVLGVWIFFVLWVLNMDILPNDLK